MTGETARAGGLALRLRHQLRRAWFRGLVLRGADVTPASRRARCLVVAPHPDDETLGCGATIAAKRAAGTDVRVVIVTDGRRSHGPELIDPDELATVRAREAVEACGALGVARGDVVQLGWVDSSVAGRIDELEACLARIIADFGPHEVLVPCATEVHPDHRAVSEAVRRLAAKGSTGWRVAEYAIELAPGAAFRQLLWGSPAVIAARRPPTEWLSRLVGARPELVAAGRAELDAKRRAIGAYRSQTTPLAPGATAGLSDHDVAKFLVPYEVFWRPYDPTPRD